MPHPLDKLSSVVTRIFEGPVILDEPVFDAELQCFTVSDNKAKSRLDGQVYPYLEISFDTVGLTIRVDHFQRFPRDCGDVSKLTALLQLDLLQVFTENSVDGSQKTPVNVSK